MSNIRTIADIQQQDQHSVQSIVLRGSQEEVSVTTLAPRPVLNDDLREIAGERLRNGDFRLPIRNNANGLPAGDVEEMRNLNASLGEESIRNILESIAENRFNQEVFEDILSHFSPEFLDRTRNVLSQPYNTLQDFAPILNIMIYANVGFYDFNASSINLANLLSDINPPVEVYENNLENNLEEVVNSIEENVNSANDDAERRNEEYNQERSSIINSMNWRTILRRGGTLLFMGAVSYIGAPYLGPLGSLGMRLLENSGSILPTSSIETDITPRTSGSRITWNDVSGSFWGSWSLLARYMGNRSD